jgi:serine/threonine-protein kinase
MIDDPRIRELVEETLNSDRTPEEVCLESPELLQQVRARLERLRNLVAEIEVLFPSGAAGGAGDARQPIGEVLPRIPGHEVRAVLGRGGMGVVYAARHLKLNREVAVKMLLAGEYATPKELARFLREAEAVANLCHPNIVQVHDVSELDGRPFFTMELVEGGSLAQRLAGTPQPVAAAVAMVKSLAEAVEVAHRGGIIHRDLKPANVLVSSDGTPKISDFGLARKVGNAASLTASGTVLGTPSYMAPEQVKGSPDAIGPAVDVYALGAILYETLTGRPPFRSESALATQMQVLAQEPVRPSQLNGRVPRDLETICLKCLQKEPSWRYASAVALAEDLGRFERGEPIAARQASLPERAVRWVRRNPTRAALTVTALVLFGVAAASARREWMLAAGQRAEIAKWTPKLELVTRLQTEGRFPEAREVLQGVPDFGSSYLRDRIQRACSELNLAEHLDAIRMDRSALVEGRFDVRSNKAKADREYELAFRKGGLGAPNDDPGTVARRAGASPIHTALVAALDDWAVCTEDERRMGWILEVARAADPDPDGWRDRVRDPGLAGEALDELARTAIVEHQSVQILVALGQRMQDAGADALDFLGRIQRQFPMDFWANFTLGLALSERTPVEAIRYYQAALAIRPQAAVVHLDLGRALAASNRIDDAIVHYRRAIDIDPTFSHAITDLGLALSQEGMLTEALELTRQAVRLDTASARNHNNVGDVLARMELEDEALAEFQQALALDPDYAYAHYNVIRLFERQGRFDEARAHCEHVIRVAPALASGHIWLGRILMDEGHTAEAIPELELASRLGPTEFGAHYMLAECLRAAGRSEQGLYHYNQSLTSHPYPLEFEARIKAGRRAALLDLGRAEEARYEWERELALGPAEHDAWYGYAELCLFLAKDAEYRQACRDLLERFEGSTDPQVCERTGRSCLLGELTDDEFRRASALIGRAVHADRTLSPAWAYPYFLVAQGLALYRAGDWEGAIRVLQGDPSRVLGPLPHLVLAMANYRAGRAGAAWRSFATAIDSYDWDTMRAVIIDAWIYHAVRREAERLVLPNLPALLDGQYRAEQADELTAMIAACRSRRLTLATARLFAGAFEADHALAEDLEAAHRYHAACAAARVGEGIGEDAALVSDRERTRWREQARRWLWDDLTAREALLEDPSSAELHELANWLADPELAGLREQSELAKLPPSEREDCLELWHRVEELLATVQAEESDTSH